MKKYTNQGFTLIELLVVIAIIGILSGIVLTSLSGARNKASDAKIQSDISGFRTAAELYFTNHNNSYGVSSVGSGTGVCNDANGETQPYVTGLTNGTALPVCNSTAVAYAIAKELVTSTTASPAFWCADSTGASKKTTSAPAGVTCPVN